MPRRRSDRVALSLLALGLVTMAIGLAVIALGSGVGAWFGLVGTVLTFGVLGYAIYFRV